jgi:kynurenine 3-monooxygenase
MIEPGPVNIVGAGPTGTLLAILLRRRGFDITLYESRKDPRGGPGESGRSINLALADRGIHALQMAGVYDDIAASLVAMRGRLIHHTDGTQSLQLYGQRPSEVIYSISRHRLTQALLEVAVGRHGVQVHFEHRMQDADFQEGTARIQDIRQRRSLRVPMNPLIATDGGGSVARRRMAELGLIHCVEAELGHGYKELTIPATASGGYAMAPDALHIWPRGNFMLIALPNADGSFTATLFLAKHGAVSFEALDSRARIEEFLRGQFPDAYRLMPTGLAEIRHHPTGLLSTVYADQWHVNGRVGLVGDAAHAIVPFHGQGMNCCFEDCLEFDACVARQSRWQAAFEDFFASRKPNTDAIAAMALENYLEMRERVIDPKFRLQQMLAMELERRHPQRFIPRYSMVMFHHEIPYETAQRRGTIQTRLLTDLTADAATLEDIDFARADRDVNRLLTPIPGGHAPA